MQTQNSKDKNRKRVAYFSMEIAMDDAVPNYYGGLGVLAADILYSCADLEVPVVGVSLIYHKHSEPEKAFHPENYFTPLKEKASITIEGRQVHLGVYKKEIRGRTGFIIPIYFLTSNLPENSDLDKNITKNLYSSDWYIRLCQEYALGIGGVRMLEELGEKIDHYHMNEGHSALLTLELLRKKHYDQEAVKSICTFTSHTPISAGHDYFDYDMAYKVLGELMPLNIKELATQDRFGMTQLAMSLSKSYNSVSDKHRQVCDKMFPGSKFENVTNGIYHPRWISESFEKLYDKELPTWREDPQVFSRAEEVLNEKEIVEAKKTEKRKLIEWINKNPDFFPFENPEDHDLFDEETLTIVFARRCVSYKRHDLIFKNIEKLRDVGYKKVQLIFASSWRQFGAFGSQMRAKIQDHGKKLRGQIKIAILPEYNLDIARRLVSGTDLWLNNPVPPLEASGTSGMKAALNGAMNLSILDGWWIEGMKMKAKSGWGFGLASEFVDPVHRDEADSLELYRALEDAIGYYYKRREEWNRRMKESIALLSYFNTHRVVEEYYEKMWD